MRHIKQLSNFDCGAASYAMITGVSVFDAIKECKTKLSGTSTFNVQNALKRRGLKNKLIEINLPIECVYTHLKLISNDCPIYVSAEFISNSGKGRNSIRRHAIVIKDEKVFDPGENKELPIDCIGHLYNRQLLIKRIILVGIE